MIDEIVNDFKEQTDGVVVLLQDDLKKIKTGRAKPSLIEGLKVEAYNTVMELRELASIKVSDSHSLVVSPWDKSLLKVIEKAIASSNLNLSPVVDNDILRISIPLLTEETRKDLVKLVFQKVESGKILLRQARNEAKSKIERLKEKSGVSEDDVKKWLEELQEQVSRVSEKIESLGKEKEKELVTI